MSELGYPYLGHDEHGPIILDYLRSLGDDIWMSSAAPASQSFNIIVHDRLNRIRLADAEGNSAELPETNLVYVDALVPDDAVQPVTWVLYCVRDDAGEPYHYNWIEITEATVVGQ